MTDFFNKLWMFASLLVCCLIDCLLDFACPLDLHDYYLQFLQSTELNKKIYKKKSDWKKIIKRKIKTKKEITEVPLDPQKL